MIGIDDFFSTREKINKALTGEEYECIKNKFVRWMYRQCMNYSAMTESERQLAKNIPVLDNHIRMEFFWPKSFSKSKINDKVITVVTHELSRTGAPLVLLDAVRMMRNSGYFVLLFSFEDGDLKEEFLDCGIPVILADYLKWIYKINENTECRRFLKIFESIVLSTNLLFCNTVVSFRIVNHFSGMEFPVFWWIHEGDMSLDIMGKYLPECVRSNISTYYVSEYSRNAFEKRGFIYDNAKILSYGINDVAADIERNDSEKNIFLIAGTITRRKAQDVVLQAIEELDASVQKNCRFLFAGKIIEDDVYEMIHKASNKLSCIEYVGELNHKDLLELMESSDCIVCPSREDSMPVVATEAFSMGKIVICSDHTGTAEYIQNSINGFVINNEDSKMLGEYIDKVSSLSKEEKLRIGKKSRTIFENNFTFEVFEEKLLSSINSIALDRLSELDYSNEDEKTFLEYIYDRLIYLNDLCANLEQELRKSGDIAYANDRYLHGRIDALESENQILEKQLKESNESVQQLDDPLSDVFNSISRKSTSIIRKIGTIVCKMKK